MASIKVRRLPLRVFWQKIRPSSLRDWSFRFWLSCIFLVMESVTSVTTPWLFSRMVGRLSVHETVMAAIMALLAQYTVLRMLGAVAGPVRSLLMVPVRAALRERISLLGLEHIHRLSARFHQKRQTGVLTRTIDRGADAASTIVDMVFSNVLPNVLGLGLTFLVVLRVFSGLYLMLLCGTMLLYGGISFVFTRWRMQARRARNQANGNAHRHLVDSLLNADIVRSFGNVDHEIRRQAGAWKELRAAEIRLQTLIGSSQAVRNMLISLATAGLLGLAILDIHAHRLGVAQFVLMGTYLRSVYASVGALNYVSAGWRNARVDMEAYLELMALEPDIQSPAQPVSLPAGRAEGVTLEMRHVSFGHDPGRLILRDVSFRLEAGKMLAIVGRSGSGKSTLAKLASRLYDPLEGMVFMEGVPLPSLSLEELRAQIGVVAQDTSLFNASMAENIAYGRVGASMEEIRHAAEAAQLAPLIERLPDGFGTLVGERGVRLSGGERQRMAIARVILRNPRLLVLDEATSALDTRTEEAIQTALQGLSAGRTTLVIAHRLSTIQQADHIIVMDAGAVAEEGTHRDLLEKGGIYAGMWRLQAGGGSVESHSDVEG
ncbi:ATP-binding cassette domain-containing protein [Bombella sp. TMW 2.2559]|uniref:ATP-binding cassette domain-containing protein n=1 Tax=Bombella dulcis TaxID=2967339 RepID=A0ABT3WA16_9PROT|nr:ATP-binding cassette domain-containing protein [Bombella dulcis]MCX5615924.1 ATP-binding cassette domain-containing protein [Bombella dulcis]